MSAQKHVNYERTGDGQGGEKELTPLLERRFIAKQ